MKTLKNYKILWKSEKIIEIKKSVDKSEKVKRERRS